MDHSHSHLHSHSHDHKHSETCSHSAGIASALMPGLEASKLLQQENKYEISQRRIVDLTKKITRVESNLKSLEENRAREGICPGDWTQSYQYWNKWDDVEELQKQATEEQSNLQSMYEKANMMGHCHDHGEERKMFHLPETDKIRFCERHRILGNLLYEEGLLPKAAEQYQTALSYYEYCFPEDDETQRSLDTVRYAALCNISLCYCRMGLLREAEAAATQAVRESEDRRSTLPEVARAKAYYRRAQVHRKLDDYESAMADLRRVLALCPDDPAAKQELSLAQQQKKSYMETSQQMASAMMRVNDTPAAVVSAMDQPQSTKRLAASIMEDVHRIASGQSVLEDRRAVHITSLIVDIPLEPNLKEDLIFLTDENVQ